MEPNHNKVNYDEYDFARHNDSVFAALDSTLPNSYSNNMLQVIVLNLYLYPKRISYGFLIVATPRVWIMDMLAHHHHQALFFIAPFRAAILRHLCTKEFCLACELSFLFHMLTTSLKITPCQASNFLRAFRTMPLASALGLLLPEDEDLRKKFDYTRLAQSWMRFVSQQLHTELCAPTDQVFESPKESRSSPDKSPGEAEDSMVAELFGMKERCAYRCLNCDNSWEKESTNFQITLTYADTAGKRLSPAADHHTQFAPSLPHAFASFALMSASQRTIIRIIIRTCGLALYEASVRERFLMKTASPSYERREQ